MRFQNMTPLEIMAFYKLDKLSAADIQPICERWMELDLGRDEVACLAFEPCLDLWSNKRDIDAAFAEVLGDLKLSRHEATWLVFRNFISNLLAAKNDANDLLSKVINLTYENFPPLFQRTDNNYAANEFGIEGLYGIYYSRDHLPEWPPNSLGWPFGLSKEFEEFKTEMKTEAEAVLERFFSSDSELPETLHRVQRLVSETNC